MPIKISTSPAIFRWRPACWLRVTGEDAATFLQGQFTNDLRALDKSPAVYGLWLTLKGKALADSFVLRGSGAAKHEFWIGSYFSPAQVIRERLESHVIADDVIVEDVTADWAGVSFLDEGAAARAQAWVTRGDLAEAVRFPGRRDRDENIEVVYRVAPAAGEPSALQNAQDVPALTDEDMLRRRIAVGIPAVPADIGPADLPNEAGLEAEAISYTKGCYLGQEVMARLKSMGQVRRRLLRVAGSGDAPRERPAPVFVGARQVGELRSAVSDGEGGWIGLAMVTLMHIGADATLAFSAEAAPTIRLLDTP